MQALKKSSKKKRSNPENDQNMHSFETSNIKFGKLDIVLKSFNSLPTMQSFYENIPEITNCSNDHIFSSEIKKNCWNERGRKSDRNTCDSTCFDTTLFLMVQRTKRSTEISHVLVVSSVCDTDEIELFHTCLLRWNEK